MMKKETRTTRLLSKKQGQKTVTLGMVVTLFAPLLLAPIANAEEIPASESIEVTQQLAEAPRQTEAPSVQDVQPVQTPEEIVTPPAEKTTVSEPVEEPIQTEATENVPVVETTESAIADITAPDNEATQSPVTEPTTPEVEEAVTTTEALSDDKWIPDPNVIMEFQGIIDGYAAQIADLETLGANNDMTLWHQIRSHYGMLEAALWQYTQGVFGNGDLEIEFNYLKEDFDFVCPLLENEIQELRDFLNQNPTIVVTGVTLSELPELTAGETHQLTATVTPTNATNTGVSYSSSNPSVATVDANGNVTAISAGNYSITVTTTDGGFTATASGTVTEALPEPEVPVIGISLSQTTLNVKEGDSAKLTATVTPNNATNQAIVWSIDNVAIATIDSSGNVTGVNEGTATVTATSVDGNFTATCTITVTKKAIVNPPVKPNPEPKPNPTPNPLPTPIGTSPKDNSNSAQSGNNNGTVAKLPIDLSTANKQSANNSSKADSLPQTGETETASITLLGMILVGITAIGTFLFKRKSSH
ncbi:Ig-like domain-containing protein [Enterococcus sp. BWM-S5]|uniref:Ig-like domain-containing protein n=1 Tax=Enterococcus larvae TaxID=2794352 RepID=A0ABS4CHW0_9ENTE|nr:Ig-like domain-containing protein [Enterococcus larvae]MBP1046215.1 Ig-like domain-containing protein [Enterococcus larvae]